MKKMLLFFVAINLLSCDDGNIDIPEFSFDNTTINYCGDLVLSKINDSEVLIIELDEDNTDNAFLTEVREDGDTYTLSESGSNTITYRTFDSEPSTNYFCQNIPPTSPTVINEWTGEGDLVVTTLLTIDDEDGVAAEDEDINGDGNYDNDFSDDDAIPDYLDFDDDNDGIKTIDEDVDGDDDPTNDDTDDDGIPNYLDIDDDGDGVNTIDEELTDTDLDGGGLDYLDPNANTPRTESRSIAPNTYVKTYKNTFIIYSLQLTNTNGNSISYDIYPFNGLNEIKVPETETEESGDETR